MKILVLSNLYPPFYLGGYEIGCRNVVEGLRRRGHEVLVLTTPSHVPEVDSAAIPHKKTRILRRLQLRSFQPINSHGEHVTRLNHLEAMVTNFSNTSVVLEIIREFSPDCVYLFNLVGLGGLSIIDSLNILAMPWVFHLMDRVPQTLQSGISEAVLSIFNAQGGNIYEPGKIVAMSKHLVNEIETLCGFHFRKNVDLIPGWTEIGKGIFERGYFQSGKVRFVTAGAVQSTQVTVSINKPYKQHVDEAFGEADGA